MSKNRRTSKKVHPSFDGLAETMEKQIARSGLSEAKVARIAGVPTSTLQRILSGKDSASLRGALRLKFVLGIPISGSAAPKAKPPVLDQTAAKKALAEADMICNDLPALVRAARLRQRRFLFQFGQRQALVQRFEQEGHNIALVVISDLLDTLGLPLDTRKPAWNKYRALVGGSRKRKAQSKGEVSANDFYDTSELKRIDSAWKRLNQVAAKRYLSVFLRNGADRQSVLIGAFASDYVPSGGYEYPPVSIRFSAPEHCSANQVVKAIGELTERLQNLSPLQIERNRNRRMDRQTREKWANVSRKGKALQGNRELTGLTEGLFPDLPYAIFTKPKSAKRTAPPGKPPGIPRLTGAAAECYTRLVAAAKPKGYKVYRQVAEYERGWMVEYIIHPETLPPPSSIKDARGPAQAVPVTAGEEQAQIALETLRKRVLVAPSV